MLRGHSKEGASLNFLPQVEAGLIPGLRLARELE